MSYKVDFTPTPYTQRTEFKTLDGEVGYLDVSVEGYGISDSRLHYVTTDQFLEILSIIRVAEIPNSESSKGIQTLQFDDGQSYVIKNLVTMTNHILHIATNSKDVIVIRATDTFIGAHNYGLS